MGSEELNCFVDPAENKGVTSHRISKSLDFIQRIMDCNFFDALYLGSPFICCNGWFRDRRVWKRIDRVLTSFIWANIFVSTNISHLIRTGSHHSPFFIKDNTRYHIKYFRFLDFCMEEPDFQSVTECT